MNSFTKRAIGFSIAALSIIAALATVASSCTGPVAQAGPQGPKGDTGAPGAPGAPGVSTGTLSGKITNTITKGAVSGVAVTVDPPIANVTITTDANGAYSATLPVGIYTLSYKKTGFDAVTQTASVTAAQTITKDVAVKPTAAVSVTAAITGAPKPDATVTIKATASVLDGSQVTGYKWKQTAGVQTAMSGDTTDTLTVTLPRLAQYKLALTNELENLERIKVVGLNNEVLAVAQTTKYSVTVTTSTGTYTATASVIAALPYSVSTGLQDVPAGVAVLMQGKTQAAYSWTISAAPKDSKAALADADTRFPVLVPDVVGKYTVTESTSKATLDIYAGTWAGGITGMSAQGIIQAQSCTVCHDGKNAPDNFTDWSKSGHAYIFTSNINNPAGHWSINCAQCHTVGYDPNATNNGFDEAVAADKWTVPAHGDVGLFSKLLSTASKVTSLSNIQCENCHGPNNGTGLHPDKAVNAARVSISAEVCGYCHGEPPRHGRLQQWETSGHGNFETAISESSSASCARCHTGQGYLAWTKQDMSIGLQGAKGNITTDELKAIVNPDTAQPITCAVCHDTHALGSTLDPTKTDHAILRFMDNTPMLPSGYAAQEVGMGALCITCHNTRNGAKGDSIAVTAYQAPHRAAQGDVLLGFNAYFVVTPERSPHAAIKDTCVTCHMEKTPAPAGLSMPGSGTNHSFTASIEICSDCHTDSLNGEAFQQGYEAKIETLGAKMGTYLTSKMGATFQIKEYTPHTYGAASYDGKSNALAINKADVLSAVPGEIHGQQGFILTLKTPYTFTYPATATVAQHTVSLNTVQFQLGDITADGATALIPVTDNLVKAGWNYYLAEADSSLGVHNPKFTDDLLNGAISALK